MTLMTSPETVQMCNGEPLWRVYTHGVDEVYLSSALASDEADRIHDMLTASYVSDIAQRVANGGASIIYQAGEVALKQFHTLHSFRHMPELHGRLENLRTSVQLSHALRNYPQSTNEWSLRGLEYYGARINPLRPELARWAMQYVNGQTLSAQPQGSSFPEVNNQSALVLAQYKAAKSAGMDIQKIFFDNKRDNFMVTLASLSRPEGRPFDIVRLDIGACEAL